MWSTTSKIVSPLTGQSRLFRAFGIDALNFTTSQTYLSGRFTFVGLSTPFCLSISSFYEPSCFEKYTILPYARRATILVERGARHLQK